MTTHDVAFVRKDDTQGRGPAFPATRPLTAPPYFHVLAKPTGPICNLDCEYCFFLSKEALYPGDRFRMTDDVLDTYIRQLIESQTAPEVTIAWQGGEPTLMGVDFFRRAVDARRAVPPAGPGGCSTRSRPTARCSPTSGASSSHEHEFLVGISIDGPPRAPRRVPRRQAGRARPSTRCMRGLELLRAHGVDYQHPLHGQRREPGSRRSRCTGSSATTSGARHIQLIPIVERDNDTGFQEGDTVTDRSVDPEAWGRVPHRGVRRVGRARRRARCSSRRSTPRSASWLGVPPGDVHLRARRAATPSRSSTTATSTRATTSSSPTTSSATSRRRTWSSCSRRPQQRAFGDAKRDTLPAYCRECDVRFACHGECPKNRFTLTPDGEPGLNYLCAGLPGVLHPHRRPRCASWPTCCATAATPTR